MFFVKRIRLFIFILVISVGLLATACSSASPNVLDNGTADPLLSVSEPSPVEVSFSTEYVMATREELIDEADVILVGRVNHISPTRWNQDSGEYWEEVTTEGEFETAHSALPVHYLEIEIVWLIVDDIGIEEKFVTLTAVGKSPVDDTNLTEENNIQVAGLPDHHLQAGNEVIIFIRQTELAWHDEAHPITFVQPSDGSSPYFQGTTRTVLQFSPAPGFYLLKDTNGLYANPGDTTQELVSLDFLVAEIAKRRQVIEPTNE